MEGRVERVTYASPETGFAVLQVRPPRGARFTATGVVPELAGGAGLAGAEFRFRGAWTVNKYGRQFAFTRCTACGGDLLFFLSKVVKGLGPKLARQLLDRFGEEALVRILDEDPARLLNVKGIKERRLELILRSWRKFKNLKALSKVLGGAEGGVTPNLLIRIYNHFGDEAAAVVRADPYRLTEVRGIGFRTADRIAMALGVPPGDPARVRAALNHVLVKAAEEAGHSYLTADELRAAAAEVLGDGDDTAAPVDEAAAAMVADGTLVRGPGGETGLSGLRHMEDWLRDFFAERARAGDRPVLEAAAVERFIADFEARHRIEFAPEQREILVRTATEPATVFALAGYAGTGKTTVCRAVLDLLAGRLAAPEEIVCCAFTGMASARLRKATGYEAFTIHSLLKYQGEGRFEHGPDNPLPHRVVVLDEASMVNLPLFYRLARSLRPGTLFLMVGDPAQLPPIGAGNVFGDVLDLGLVPAVHLTRIYRQSPESVLALFANEIRRGRIPEGVEAQGWRDFAFEPVERHNIYALKARHTEAELKRFREENNQAILERICELARDWRDRLTHPVWDFQVLTPMRVGQLGTENLNARLREILNPGPGASFQRAGLTLKEGDKVVHLQNRDMAVMAWADFARAGKTFSGGGFRRVFNGNVGLVARVDPEAQEFYVVYPERIVVAYDFDHLGDIVEPAFALTVHKAQGAQYRVVAIPLTNSHFIMLNNKWFYTAITRAEEKAYLVGQRYALKRACTNVESARRRTWLGRAAAREVPIP
ncbi:AAA family ATPase [Dissulfurirhabdus thermomarina]|uniref:AAA family ATPase n=1 Tax=Dissulfurirhabdus thermomarina TaxID=1765737 RepID=A0A6N9TWB9_DISTH|nr:AAA family ATPase [Dissulfurirhabdus thermomarina]NDY42776.1 AAA family ATPase [Dissulfurirhabdus thermomarina]